jgi:hypothetical protein
MLCVTITIVVVILELLHEILDAAGGDRIRRRAGFVHEDHVGLDRNAASDAEPLLLASGEAHGGVLQAVLDLVP